MTRQELAAAFAAHPMTITKWEAAGLPVAERGGRGRPSRYRLTAVLVWYIARELQARGGGGAALDLQQERARQARALAELNEHRLAERRKELVPVREVDLRWSRIVVTSRDALLGLSTKAKQRLPHLTVKDAAEIDHLVREALEGLADGGKS